MGREESNNDGYQPGRFLRDGFSANLERSEGMRGGGLQVSFVFYVWEEEIAALEDVLCTSQR